jgi:hypothetical protein
LALQFLILNGKSVVRVTSQGALKMIIDTVSSLTRRARDLYSDRRMAAKWVLAARNLRARRVWILEGAAPKWGYRPLPAGQRLQCALARCEGPLQY